jgi:DDE superfamily endonuclease
MLQVHSLPGSLMRVLEPFRPCFTTTTFTTFVSLLAGMIAQPASRTVCGMLAGAGLAGVWHHSRAHRFFAAARWHPDTVGLAVLRLIVGHLVPIGSPLVVAIDDTMFRRCGRKVYAAHWGYGGSLKVAKGNEKLSRGNTFVVAAVVVRLPFLDRPVALPILARLWRKGGPAKTVLARELVEVIAAAIRGRMVHVIADGAYLCTELRRLPPNVTLTGPLRSNASLWHVHPDLDNPPRLRERGRPQVYGARIGTPADVGATVPATLVTVTRYGRTTTVQVHHQRCLWRGVFGARPVQVLVIAEPGKPSLALVTTDPTTPIAAIVERYATRWAIEVAFHDAKNTTGVGEARNRSQPAVERTVPFGLYTQSIVIIWYHLAGHHPSVVRDRHSHAPWYATKACPSYLDMIVKLRRVLIVAQYQPEAARQPTHEEIRAVQLAWAQAAAKPEPGSQ